MNLLASLNIMAQHPMSPTVTASKPFVFGVVRSFHFKVLDQERVNNIHLQEG